MLHYKAANNAAEGPATTDRALSLCVRLMSLTSVAVALRRDSNVCGTRAGHASTARDRDSGTEKP